jgi:hypothetical protein
MFGWLCNHDFHDAEHCTEDVAVSLLARLREGEIVSSSSEEPEVWTILLPSNMCIVISTFVISCVHVYEDS